MTASRYDWHDSACAAGTWADLAGTDFTTPCDCEMPRLFRSAFEDGLKEAKRRLSVIGMHDGKCPEPKRPCTCGLDQAIDTEDPPPWNEPAIEP